ncbi:hypothetical protein V8G54_014323 [Vigna mungo]|uniref:CYTH domain-containing protein n=1 Tax=Vigna mungo TaxID=3915 RepID=A0AAQ3NJ55_VIGMU
MEVEVKLRLVDANVHRRVISLLSPFYVVTHRQKNLFFDSAASELSERRTVLRLRFYGDNEWCVVSLKTRAVLVDTVSRVKKDKEDLNLRVRHECIAELEKLGSVEFRVLSEEYELKRSIRLGGFGRR